MKGKMCVLFLWLALHAMTIFAQGWKGIKPLHSTCDDVKRALNVDKCTSPMSEYNVLGFRVIVFFSENKDCKKDPRGWRITPSMVTSVVVHPDEEMLPSALGLDLSKYQRWEDGEIVGVEHYESRKEGVMVDLYQGFVQTVYVSPPCKRREVAV
jgi:hypothetical protein